MIKIKYIKPDGGIVLVRPVKTWSGYSPAQTDRIMLKHGYRRKNRK